MDLDVRLNDFKKYRLMLFILFVFLFIPKFLNLSKISIKSFEFATTNIMFSGIETIKDSNNQEIAIIPDYPHRLID